MLRAIQDKLADWTIRCGLWLKALAVWLLARALLATIRVRRLGPAQGALEGAVPGPGIYAFWHGRQLALVKAIPVKGLVVLTSLSRDGELQSRILRRFGLEVVRGSSSRGGLGGLLALGRGLKAGRSVGMAVDGPRGPVYSAKPGAVALASRTATPIIPLGACFQKRWELTRAWDRFQIPKPFTIAWVALGAPIHIPTRLSPQELQEKVEELNASLLALTREVETRAQQQEHGDGL